VDGLNKLGLDCFEPKGAFYAFPSIKSTGMTSEEFAGGLLKEEKVAVVLEMYSGLRRGTSAVFICNIGEQLVEALGRIESYLDKVSCKVPARLASGKKAVR